MFGFSFLSYNCKANDWFACYKSGKFEFLVASCSVNTPVCYNKDQ